MILLFLWEGAKKPYFKPLLGIKKNANFDIDCIKISVLICVVVAFRISSKNFSVFELLSATMRTFLLSMDSISVIVIMSRAVCFWTGL